MFFCFIPERVLRVMALHFGLHSSPNKMQCHLPLTKRHLLSIVVHPKNQCSPFNLSDLPIKCEQSREYATFLNDCARRDNPEPL
jgi:hypothetical protein